MYYYEYAHLLKKHMEHTCMSAIYYDQGRDGKAKQCKTIVTFDTIPESKILDASDLLIDFNKNKEKILQYIKYAENWQVVSVICSCTAMTCMYSLS